MKKYRWCCWLAPAVFLLDRATKVWAQRVLFERGYMPVIPGVFGLTYVENTGAAFGMLQGRQTLLIVVTGLLLLGGLVYLLTRGRRLPPLAKAASWVLLGGAVGNLYDRAVYGYVIDLFEIELFRFPVFNIADVAVCVAFVLLAGWILFGKEMGSDGEAA